MATKRLPGIYFETVVPPVPEPLPRLDIAAFVGFAQSGPLNVPVAVEDTARYQEIFGKDQALAWDPVAGETVYAQLSAVVRAFFRNGGERCWIVRVADDAQATANEFVIPGMLRADPGVPYQAAWLKARSEGSWSDDLMVNATLSFLPLEAGTPIKTADGISLVLNINSATPVAPGDLLQLAFEGAQGSPPSGGGRLLFLPIDSVSGPTGTGTVQQSVVASQGYWFQIPALEDFSQLHSSPPTAQSQPGLERLIPPASVTWLTRPEEMELSIGGWAIETGTDSLQFVLEVSRNEAEDITPGSWLRVKFGGMNLPHGMKELLLLVDSVRGSASSPAAAAFSPSSDQEPAQIVATSAWWVLDNTVAWSAHLPAGRADVVTLELWVRDGAGRITTLSDLGLSASHEQYLGYLPSDAQLFVQKNQPSTPPGSALRALADHPRFSLAAPSQDFSVTDATPPNVYPFPLYLPLGVPGIVKDTFYQPAIPQAALPLERDGLALNDGKLHADLFLDPDLAGSNINTLLTEAFHKQYQLQRGGDPGPPGKPLLKMHAVLPLDEVSFIAVPDAQHLGWRQSIHTQQILGAPELKVISTPTSDGKITVSWVPVDEATSYTLQESADPLFVAATDVWKGAGQPDAANPALLESEPFPQPSDCPSARYFRVHANQGLIAGPWSNTLSRTLPPESFEQCSPVTLAPPVIAEPVASRGRVVLEWSAPQPALSPPTPENFQLQAAYEPDFVLPQVIYEGPDSHFELWSDPSRNAYFRVRVSRAEENSPWSNTVVAQSDQVHSRFEMNVPATPADALESSQDELLKVHQALVRLCAARGDVFSWLSVPRAFDADACVRYSNQLTALMAPEDGDRTLSFTALYFPWLIVRDSSDDQPGAVRSISPEGAICGSAAALTLSSGAWWSPANQILKGVVDLDPKLPELAAETFFNNQLNLVIQEASGFLTMSSFTLSPSVSMTEINVRRLLILLRRLALREGVDYVFQSNEPSLWRVVQRRFEEILRNLFLQGAFAGNTQDESFRVRTDSSVNPQTSIDQGRFIVELSIAPSLPMEFLTVRLLQAGGDLMLSEQH